MPAHAVLASLDAIGNVVVEKSEIKRFMLRCLSAAGADFEHANQLADTLIAADEYGHYTHGLNRLDLYVNDLLMKSCESSGTPVVLKEQASTAWIDGQNLLGPVVGNFCMDLAIKKAKESGVGWVVCKGSNHYGIAGWYSMRACKQGLIGMAFTNTSPLAVPTRSNQVAIGSNPISVAAPALAGDQFFLDMATPTVLMVDVENAVEDGKAILHGWASNSAGMETLNPKEAIGTLPLGGMEETGGYKGYGLSLFVELICGILGGAHWGPNVRKWAEKTREADLGQCFVAIDSSAFAPDFSSRLQEMLNTFRSLPKVEENLPVLIPGDPETQHMKACKKLGGIPYNPKVISRVNDLAAKLKLEPIKIKSM